MTRRHPMRPLVLRALFDRRRHSGGLTLVEMLVAMAITLLIMGAVVTVFANISGSVTRRRATIEMSSALRNVRETLARDLAGATCPAIPWQRPESNHGYLEIIEGPQNDYYPTPWLWDGSDTGAEPDGIGSLPGIDLSVSSLPGSNLERDPLDDIEGRGLAIGSNEELPEEIATDGRGLGDADDILMLTVRNEKQPFVGRIPPRTGVTPATPGSTMPAWRLVGSTLNFESVESQLAEVVWFAVENPVDPQRTFAFGEPGYRTIHRRALLILPEIDYGIRVTAGGVGANGVPAGPGVVRVLPASVDRNDLSIALAGLIAFQDRYDLSVRVEWDSNLPGLNGGRWVLRANSLGDLTKRENRYEHHGYVYEPVNLIAPAGNGNTPPRDRYYPHAVASAGFGNTQAVDFRSDREIGDPADAAEFRAVVVNNRVVAYEPSTANTLDPDRRYAVRPLVRLTSPTDTPATARAILNEDGHIVHVTRGMAPLGGSRRGDDIMMTDALAFDLRVYDPGAPLYAYYEGALSDLPPVHLIQPGDPGWAPVYSRDANGTVGDNLPVLSANYPFRFERQGAYVDLGYVESFVTPSGAAVGTINAARRFVPSPLEQLTPASWSGLIEPRFKTTGLFRRPATPDDVALSRLYKTYDTWSYHLEANGVDDDLDGVTDEGVNGLDDSAVYGGVDEYGDGFLSNRNAEVLYGPDDYAERETRPPYDSALRGMQVTLRAYERDSRQIREVNIRESFVPE